MELGEDHQEAEHDNENYLKVLISFDPGTITKSAKSKHQDFPFKVTTLHFHYLSLFMY